MKFEIVLHDSEDIIEVVYPAAPDDASVASYVMHIKKLIVTRTRPWSCLVDQRNVLVMPPSLVDTMRALNAFAKAHGMMRSARVVASAVGNLQVSRIARTSNAPLEIRSFADRSEALQWLSERRSLRPTLAPQAR
ncbi:MAG: hypothetical protein NVS3B20_05620 [Polyangiales bacterium]